MRVEVARVRFPLAASVLTDLVTALEAGSDWTEMNVAPVQIINGAAWLIITAEVNQ